MRTCSLCFSSALLACLAGGLAVSAYAQEYPVKPVRLVIPFAPGGTNDVVGRLIGVKLAGALGQQVVIDNRGGAGGSIGAALVAKAAPGGPNSARGRNWRGNSGTCRTPELPAWHQSGIMRNEARSQGAFISFRNDPTEGEQA